MGQIKYGVGFILALAILFSASSLFFRNRQAPDAAEVLDVSPDKPATSKTRSQDVESIANERSASEENLDGAEANPPDDVTEEPESNLESVFVNLTQEMAKRGYAKGLSDCIESQFRENQGIENPKDLDSMLQACDNQFKIDVQQRQQVKEVVLQAIAKAQTKNEEF